MTYTQTDNKTEERVRDAVYCWVLVHHPDIIAEARELVAS